MRLAGRAAVILRIEQLGTHGTVFREIYIGYVY